MISVFYDGNCSLCSKEIGFYRKITKNHPFIWIDLSNNNVIENESFSKIDALKLLHVKDHNNNLYIGVPAFIVIWKNIPILKWLGFVATKPIIYWTLCTLYKIFSKWRFNKVATCKF